VKAGVGARLALLAAIWGISFLLIKVGDGSLAPLHVALGRVVFGGATLLVVLVAGGDRLPRDPRTWGHLAVVAVLFNTVPFALYAYGETRAPSLLAGIWNATTPLFTLAFAMLALRDERPTRERAVGLALGFVGVLVVLGVWRGATGGTLTASLEFCGAAACYGLGYVYTRRYLSGRPESVVAMSTAQMLCAILEIGVVALLIAGAPTVPSPAALAAVITLGALGTGLAYILNYAVIRDAGATVASTVTYLIPIVSTIAGIAVLHEPLAWNQPSGAVLVLAGAALSQGRLRRLLPSPREPAQA
jgi:drug/metabolite transporter (DMT)-like permease